MNCQEARIALLTAEPDELRGRGETAVAQHIASCDDCGRAARGLLVELDRLSQAVLSRAEARKIQIRRRVALLAGVPIAASLIAAIAINVRREAPAKPVTSTAAKTVSVDVAPGQQATVFNTNDPNVTVVWLSPGGDP